MNTLAIPVMAPLFRDKSLYICVMLAPDQKRSSNWSVARNAVLIMNHLRKIMVQETIDANNSNNITNCTRKKHVSVPRGTRARWQWRINTLR